MTVTNQNKTTAERRNGGPTSPEGQPIERATPADDHRKRARRRGDTLNEAIFAATLAELTEVGYAELTMKGIARRAKASKGSLYRRWPSRAELVVDAVHHGESPLVDRPNSGSLRTDVVSLLRGIARVLNGPLGEAIRGLMTEAIRDPELLAVVRQRFIEPVNQYMLEALRQGVIRGEVRPTAMTPLVANVAPDVLRQHVLVNGAPTSDALLVEIVDDIVLPLVRP